MLRIGLLLLGAYQLVNGLASLAGLPQSLLVYDSTAKDFVYPENWPLFGLAYVGTTLLFYLVPGALLIRYAPSLARKFSPPNSIGVAEYSDSGIYVTGMLVLAVFFLIGGLAGIASGLAQIVPEFLKDSQIRMLRFSIGGLLDGVVRVTAAAALYYHSLGVAESAARKSAA